MAIHEPKKPSAAKASAAEKIHQEAQHVAHYHAAQHAVKAQNKERGAYAHVAHPWELFVQRPVCANRTLAGLAAYCQLSQHYREAHEYHQYDVYQQEGAAAVCTHLIREAPYIAQSYCGAYGSHEEAEIGAPLSLVVFHF